MAAGMPCASRSLRLPLLFRLLSRWFGRTRGIEAESPQIRGGKITRHALYVDCIFPALHHGRPYDVLQAAEYDVAHQREVEAEPRIGRGVPFREQMDELGGKAAE